MREFTLPGFAAHLMTIGAEMVLYEHHALERAAVIVETEAKEEIGIYQDAAGPFDAWPALAGSTKEDRVRQGYSEDEPLLRDGTMRDSIDHAVIGKEAHIGSDLDVAVWQELGTSKIPARSFLGGAAFRKADEVAHELGAEVHAALIGQSVFGAGRLPIR